MANSNIPTTAKIVRFHECGGPEVLKLEEVPTPEPGQGEVRLRVQAIGLNRAEVLFRQGKYVVRSHPPCTLGYEAAGVVEAVGEGVDKKLLGKRFSTVPSFAADKYGVYGEVAIVPAYSLAAYPEKLSPEEGTSIWMQYLTAYGALVQLGKITRGDFVLITAASSSVGIAAIEIAKAQGAVSIATTRTSKKKAELLSLGADHVIATQEEDLVKRVGEITGGKGARVVFDPIGGKGRRIALPSSRAGRNDLRIWQPGDGTDSFPAADHSSEESVYARVLDIRGCLRAGAANARGKIRLRSYREGRFQAAYR